MALAQRAMTVPFGSFVPAVRRIVLFHRRCREGAAALDPGGLEGWARRSHPVGASAPLTGARLPKSGKALAALALLGLGNNALPFALIAWGQTHLAAGLASTFNAATPLFAVLVAHVFTAKEKLSCVKIIGTATGMVGVAWVIGPELLWGKAGVNAWAEARCCWWR
jgi:drug/metabolite transporter (DMT)-like permease